MGKILITGTGRSGTSFLVHLLSALGMDTGYTEDECFKICNNACRAGAEHTIEKPYSIIKNPNFMLEIEEIVANYEIDHVIIPIRKLEDVAKSRKNNADNHGGFGGFTFGAESYDEQVEMNSYYFFRMIEVLTKNDIPYTTISFPRMVEDSLYCLHKLDLCFKPYEKVINGTTFFDIHKRIANTDKITIK